MSEAGTPCPVVPVSAQAPAVRHSHGRASAMLA